MSVVKIKPADNTLSDHYWAPSLSGSIRLKRRGQENQQSRKFIYPMFRNWVPGLVIGLIGIGTGIVGSQIAGPGIGMGPATSFAVSALIIGTSLVGTLTGLYIAATKLIVEVSESGIQVTRTILGIPFKRFIEASSITDIKLVTKVNRSQDRVLGVVCRLNLVLNNGRYIGAGDSMYSVIEAQGVQGKMIKSLGSNWVRHLPGDPGYDFRNTEFSILGSLFILLKFSIILAFIYDIVVL